jgi:hypothetical protein
MWRPRGESADAGWLTGVNAGVVAASRDRPASAAAIRGRTASKSMRQTPIHNTWLWLAAGRLFDSGFAALL